MASRKWTKRQQAGQVARGRLLTEALLAIVALRRGRWTIPELADELEIHWRAAYRLVASLRAAGVTVEVSHEHGPGQRGFIALYQVPAEPLRKLLRLR